MSELVSEPPKRELSRLELGQRALARKKAAVANKTRSVEAKARKAEQKLLELNAREESLDAELEILQYREEALQARRAEQTVFASRIRDEEERINEVDTSARSIEARLERTIAKLEELMSDPGISATTYSTLSRTLINALAQQAELSAADEATKAAAAVKAGTALEEFEKRVNARAAQRQGTRKSDSE